MEFAELERRFFELKGRLAAGQVAPAAFEAAVRELTLRDGEGRLWTIGAQTGKWYYAAGGAWVEAKPPQAGLVLVPPSGSAGEPLPAAVAAMAVDSQAQGQAGAVGGRRSVLPCLAAGCLAVVIFLVLGVLGVALLLPGSPWRGLVPGWGAAGATPAVQRTVETVTPTPTPAAQVPVAATATSTSSTTPVVIVVTATPGPSTATPTRQPAVASTATSTATAQPSPTPTRPPTATPFPPSPTATAAPVAPSPLSVTLSNPHYERWGRPTDPTGCLYYNNGSPVRRFTIQIILKNNTATTISDWKGPYYNANSGASLARCYYPFNPTETTLPPVLANGTSTVTFVSFTDEGTWVSRVELTYRDRTWRWTLDVNGQVISGP